MGKQYDSDDDSDDLREKIDGLVDQVKHWQDRAFYWEGENETQIQQQQKMRDNHVVQLNKNNFDHCDLLRKADKYKLQKKYLQAQKEDIKEFREEVACLEE